MVKRRRHLILPVAALNLFDLYRYPPHSSGGFVDSTGRFVIPTG